MIVTATNQLTSILVPVFNNPRFVTYLCQTLLEQTRQDDSPWELILIDNASTEEGMEQFYDQIRDQPAVTILRNSSNLGFGRANNLGLQHSRGEFIALINSDMFVLKPWLPPMLDRLRSDPRCAGVQGKIILPHETMAPTEWLVQTCGACFNGQGLPDYHLAGRPAHAAEVNQPMRLQAVMGSGLVLRRSVIEQVGFFDEAYDLVYLEDTDLSLRISEAGYSFWYEPQAEFYHFHGASMVHLDQQVYDQSRLGNQELFQQKWPVGRIRKILQSMKAAG
ncbi:MAG: glycosyltransferase family 2 protein [Magnetococcales bacterium]|nr:glycosyltransferase family 2 protein [Magnetococcales bacterium]